MNKGISTATKLRRATFVLAFVALASACASAQVSPAPQPSPSAFPSPSPTPQAKPTPSLESHFVKNVLDDQRVSRSHARILRRADGFYVEDLESHNLTFLDDRELTPKLRPQGRSPYRSWTFWVNR